MPVARIITQYPDESQELVRQLTDAGYTVKFSSPDEEFDDADLVVSAANVHADYALQYAAEVAQESDAQVIVAPGVVRNSGVAEVETAAAVQPAPEPVAGRLRGLAQRLQSRWQDSQSARELAREQRRLERERRAMETEERRQEALRARAAEEARLAAERERLRLERQAHEEEMRRAAEEERARIAAEQERIAAERERLRAERQAQEEARRYQAEEDERRRLAEHPVPAASVPVQTPVTPPATVAHSPRVPVPPRKPAVYHPAPVRRKTQRRTMQRAVIAASIVALVLMIVFAIAINTEPSSPLPNGVANNPVQEEAPFGPARSAPSQVAIPVVHAASPATEAARPITTVPAAKPPAAHPARHERRSGSRYVAQDDVIIHHYGQTTKRAPSSQTRAGVPHYSDQE